LKNGRSINVGEIIYDGVPNNLNCSNSVPI